MLLLNRYLSIIWSLLRPQTYLLLCVYFLFGLSYSLAVQNISIDSFIANNILILLLTLFSLASWYVAGTAFNDYADFEIDKINLSKDKQRPLVQGLVNKNELLKIGIVSSVFSIFSVILVGSPAISILFLALLMLNVAYSLPPIKISHRGGIAPLMLPLGYIVLTVGSGMLIGGLDINYQALFVILGMYIHFMSRIVLKDYRDVKGDAKFGKKTLVIKFGGSFVAMLSIYLFILSTIILLYSLRDYTNSGLAILVLTAGSAATVLYYLKDAKTWDAQRPLISVYGRLCSTFVTVAILSLIAYSNATDKKILIALLIIVTSVMYLSIYDILRIQSTHKPSN